MAKYLRQDGVEGYLGDAQEIEYAKFNNLRHTVLGCMLGDYNANGEYVISPEICAELINCSKYIVDTVGEIDICKSDLKLDKQLTFMISFEGNVATLTLAEKVCFEANYRINSGVFYNINEYFLDEIVFPGDVNKNIAYRKWNVGTFGGESLNVFHMDEETKATLFNTVNRFKYLVQANKVFLEKERDLERVEGDYFLKINEILKRYPKLQKLVQVEFKEAMEEKKDFLRTDKPNLSKTLNEIIEHVIENNIEDIPKEEKEDFLREKREAQTEINVKRSEILDIKTVPVVGVNDEVETVVRVDTKGEEKRELPEIVTDFANQREIATRGAQDLAISTRVHEETGAMPTAKALDNARQGNEVDGKDKTDNRPDGKETRKGEEERGVTQEGLEHTGNPDQETKSTKPTQLDVSQREQILGVVEKITGVQISGDSETERVAEDLTQRANDRKKQREDETSRQLGQETEQSLIAGRTAGQTGRTSDGEDKKTQRQSAVKKTENTKKSPAPTVNPAQQSPVTGPNGKSVTERRENATPLGDYDTYEEVTDLNAGIPVGETPVGATPKEGTPSVENPDFDIFNSMLNQNGTPEVTAIDGSVVQVAVNNAKGTPAVQVAVNIENGTPAAQVVDEQTVNDNSLNNIGYHP
ncbi:MAG: hypothetical protein E7374_02375 [Clostridiales bacterium]|nr:hypothetical protein [Clostridiales bacterium]